MISRQHWKQNGIFFDKNMGQWHMSCSIRSIWECNLTANVLVLVQRTKIQTCTCRLQGRTHRFWANTQSYHVAWSKQSLLYRTHHWASRSGLFSSSDAISTPFRGGLEYIPRIKIFSCDSTAFLSSSLWHTTVKAPARSPAMKQNITRIRNNPLSIHLTFICHWYISNCRISSKSCPISMIKNQNHTERLQLSTLLQFWQHCNHLESSRSDSRRKRLPTFSQRRKWTKCNLVFQERLKAHPPMVRGCCYNGNLVWTSLHD